MQSYLPSQLSTFAPSGKHCLWRVADLNSKKAPKAASDLVCLPKHEGALGVLNLKKKHNEALMMKNWNKFFNKQDIPWVSIV